MKIDTMRWIDRYAGIPLCLVICNLFRLLERVLRPKSKPPNRVLLVELSEMGSAILVDPAMRWLQQQGCQLHFVIFSNNKPSLGLLNTIPEENIFTIRPDNCFTLLIDSLRFLFWARCKGIDTTIDLELFSRFTSLLCRLSGAVNRVGYHAVHEEGLYRGNHLTHPLMYNPHLHISQNFMALVRAALGAPGQPYQPVKITKEEISLARAQIQEIDCETVRNKIQKLFCGYSPERFRIMLVNPNASDLLPQRRWMPDRFVSLISQVLEKYDDILVVITGAPGERKGAGRLVSEVNHGRCINSAGVFLFQELVPLYAISELMLSNDSGPPHFASVTDLQTFVIFGPETPKLYGSLGNFTPIYAGLACSPCVNASNHRKTTCADNQCLKVISVEQVLETITPILDGKTIIKTG